MIDLRLIFTGTWNTKFQDCYHFPLLEVCDLVNKHSSLNSLLTITDQREFLVFRIIIGLKNVLNKAAIHMVCCEGVVVNYSWNIEKGTFWIHNLLVLFPTISVQILYFLFALFLVQICISFSHYFATKFFLLIRTILLQIRYFLFALFCWESASRKILSP